jgi:hypothetical protein
MIAAGQNLKRLLRHIGRREPLKPAVTRALDKPVPVVFDATALFFVAGRRFFLARASRCVKHGLVIWKIDYCRDRLFQQAGRFCQPAAAQESKSVYQGRDHPG